MENKPFGILKDANGDWSSSRLIALFMIVSSVAIALLFIYIGVYHPAVDLMKIALAISVEVGAIGGSAMIFLFGQKRTEVKESINKPTEEITN